MIGMTEGGADFVGKLGHTKFEIPIRRTSRDVKWQIYIYIKVWSLGKTSRLEIIEFAI